MNIAEYWVKEQELLPDECSLDYPSSRGYIFKDGSILDIGCRDHATIPRENWDVTYSVDRNSINIRIRTGLNYKQRNALKFLFECFSEEDTLDVYYDYCTSDGGMFNGRTCGFTHLILELQERTNGEVTL